MTDQNSTGATQDITVAQITTALQNTLSLDQHLRDSANQFLIKQCEPNPQFQIMLLHTIRSCTSAESGGVPPTPDQIQIQYQAILCMKSSLTRLLQVHRGRGFASRQTSFGGAPSENRQATPGVKTVTFSGIVPNQRRSVINEDLRNRIKQELLELIVTPDNVILSKNSYDQLTLVATIFVKYDFPASWPQMNQWLLKTLEQLQANMHNLNMEDVPRVQRFLGFYHEVLKEQSKKQLTNTKSQFIKVAKDHMKAIAPLWQFFNDQQRKMVYDDDKQTVIVLHGYNESLFAIASKLDKILMLIVKCGFSVNNLLTQPENNPYVETIGKLIAKLKLFTDCADQTSQQPDCQQKEKFMQIFIAQVKTFLKRLSELQAAENLLMYNTIDQYLMILARLLFRSEVYPIRIQKLALIAIFKVVNTDVYNAEREVSGHHDGIGMIVSPVKFKNLEPQIEVARSLFRQVMDEPVSPEDTSKQDGARRIIELVTHKFLSQVDLSSWMSDPEFFIENEDEQFLFEYDLQDDSSLNLLAQHVIEKLLQKFYPILYPFVQHILEQYITGQLPNLSVQVQDALLNLAGIVGKVQREHKVKLEKRLDIEKVFNFIKTQKWQNAEEAPIFKRRYLLILTHWVKIMPKQIFFEQFKTVCESLDNMGSVVNAETNEITLSALDKVLVFEHCQCIHEMVKEITSRIRSAEQRESGGHSAMPAELPKDIDELRGNGVKFNFSDSEEDQILFCRQINGEINYAKLCQLICAKLMPLFHSFKAPNLIWTMINNLLLILEQTVAQPEAIEECFRYFNILRILQSDTETHIYEAIIDMFKNLLIICPNSPVVLNLCCDLLDYKLSQSLNDGNTVAFWLFAMRAVDDSNQAIAKLKHVFIKFSGCLTRESLPQAQATPLVAVQSIKRDYIYQEFLQVAQEGVLLNMFSYQEICQLIQFATFKFESEIKAEKESLSSNKAAGQTSQGLNNQIYSSSDDESFDEGAFEKKANLILLQKIIYCRLEKDHGDAVLAEQKRFLLMCCSYLIESRGSLTMACSNVLFQQLVSYVNRVFIIKQADFVNAVIHGELASRGFTLAQFTEALLNKMEHVVSWEGQRMKTLTLLTLLPLLTVDVIQQHFSTICRQILNRLTEDLYLKLSNEKQMTTYSPNRFKQLSELDMSRRPNAVKIRLHEYSQRYATMKREDWPLEFDQCDIFWQKIRELMAKLNIPTIDPLVECLPEDQKQVFVNLVNGFSPKYEDRKRDETVKQQQQTAAVQQTKGPASLLQQFSATAAATGATPPNQMQ